MDSDGRYVVVAIVNNKCGLCDQKGDQAGNTSIKC